MPEPLRDPFYVPISVIEETVARLKETSQAIDHEIAEYLTQLSTEKLKPSAPLQFLARAGVGAGLVRYVAMDSRDEMPAALNRGRAVKWAIGFVQRFLTELRRLICGSGKKPKELSHQAQALISALGVAIMQQLHLDSATADGFAVLLLLTLSKALKRAFCDMTDEEVLAALKEGI